MRAWTIDIAYCFSFVRILFLDLPGSIECRGRLDFLAAPPVPVPHPLVKLCKLWQTTKIWQLGQGNIIVAVTVVAASDVVPVRLGVSSSVFLSCLRREGHGTAGGVEDSLGNPLPEP